MRDNIPWPSMNLEDVGVRSRTASASSNMPWDYHAPVQRPLKYPYRDSGFSSLSHFDALPPTPVDDYSFRGRVFTGSDVVAAPVSGVETMDALVDGMNSSSDDDHYSSFDAISSRSNLKAASYHPLYHPPLPKPPPGITLGGGLPRKSPRQSSSDSDEDRRQPSSPRRRKAQDKHSRQQSSRTSSTTTVTTRYPTFTMPKISMSSSMGSVSSRADSSTYIGSSSEEIASTNVHTESLTKSVAPSISEIIRTHAPALQQVRTRPSTADNSSISHSNASTTTRTRRHPTGLSPELDDDGDLVSRSSVDTIAEEVRRTICVQTRSPVGSTRPLSNAHADPRKAISRPQSAGTDYSRSPLSDGDHDLFTRLLDTDVTVPPPLDMSSLTKTPVDSPSQSIAQYLRSSRLTTVLKLTRGPHASRESPLNVSLSDLGSPTGVPLVVFLGLGCVRHIMGLYDEMAECLGLRLITIDRCVFIILRSMHIWLILEDGGLVGPTLLAVNLQRVSRNGRRWSRRSSIG